MNERYPMPYYGYDKIVTPERRPEIFEVGIDRIKALSGLIEDDMSSFQEITVGKKAEKDWLKIFHQMSEYPEAEIDLIEEQSGIPVSEIEKDMIDAFWGMGAHFEGIYRSWVLGQDYKKAKEQNHLSEIARIKDETNKLNIASVGWQNKVVNTLFALGRQEEGKKFLQYFWSNFESMGNQFFANDPEVAKSKNGILGSVKAIEIFEKLGFEVYSAYPEQDAIKKIDLWAKKGSNILAVQVKSKTKNYAISGGLITANEAPSNYTGEMRREVSQRNQLLTSSKEYDNIFKRENMNCDVYAYWLDLPGKDSELLQDTVTGIISFPPDFSSSEFAKQLEYDLRRTERGVNHE